MSATPQELYRVRLDAGEIKSDPLQAMVVDSLQQLHEELAEVGSPRPPSLLGRLFSFGGKTDDADRPRSLYIHGPPGRGKSMLMDLFFETATISPRQRVHVHPFMQGVHERLHKLRTGANGKPDPDPLAKLAEEIAAESPLLCFDEFQVEAIADAMIVRRLFEKLLEFGVTVVATSNTAPEDLYSGGLQRERFLPFIDLIFDRFDILTLEGETDYRRNRLKSVGIWHMPLGETAEAELESAFQRLTEGRPGEAGTITVQGRKLSVPRQARGVACFSFADLCEQALGPADYGAIARRYQTIIISDIPKLTARDRNAAKRFATLIESLYEQRTKIVCSADAAPDALYVDGDGSEIFTRVASRLEEMQADDYIAESHRSANMHVAN